MGISRIFYTVHLFFVALDPTFSVIFFLYIPHQSGELRLTSCSIIWIFQLLPSATLRHLDLHYPIPIFQTSSASMASPPRRFAPYESDPSLNFENNFQ